MNDREYPSDAIHFKAETRQLLDILIHSLYTEREIFLRELISNASDALTRIDFEILTNREVLDPDAELKIHITADPEQNTLTISDTGIGMTADELNENLGTIAHSGARAFVSAAQSGTKNIGEIIGQFGVGFYSAFMVAESIQVISRSYLPDSKAASWICSGEDTYTIQPADQKRRGTTIILKLKDDASEFTQEYRLREIVRKHSEFIAFPIYFGEKSDQLNRQTALWRQQPRTTEKEDYDEFYRQLTLDASPPLTYTHMAIDAPVQMYAILFIPSKTDRGIFSSRRDDGLKLFSRKILIQEYCKDLLPQYFRFVQGVVDSEDLPLNVARESYQASRAIAQIKNLLTTRTIDMLLKFAEEQPENYNKFWLEYHVFIKEGVATDTDNGESLLPLLRFRSTTHADGWLSLSDYVQRMKPGQTDIYYLLGDDSRSITRSPHLDYLRKGDYDVLLQTDPIDPFLMVRLTKYNDHQFVNIASADITLPDLEVTAKSATETAPITPASAAEEWLPIIQRFESRLKDKVVSIRMTDRLTSSPARLVDPEGSIPPGLQRVYNYLKEDYKIPIKILELNPSHPIINTLASLPEADELGDAVIDQIFENALIIEGHHPNPAGMIDRIHQIIQAALQK